MNSTQHTPAKTGQVPFKVKLGWGFGGLTNGFIMQALNSFVSPIYNIALGINPVLLGIALFIPRLIDAFADPIMGNISDNTRSRWGRRRPYIVIGVILTALLLPLLWIPPFTSAMGMFWYLTISVTLYSLAYTVFVVPWTALGYELSNDIDERTRVLAWQNYIGLASCLIAPWLYWLCLRPLFGGNAQLGAVWVSVAIALVIVAAGLPAAFVCRENPDAQEQAKISIVEAMRCTFQNRPFAILMAIYFIVTTGMFTGSTFGLYINIYHICGGDKSLAAKIQGTVGTMMALTSYISMPMAIWYSVRWGKRNAMILGMTLAALGFGTFWFTFIPGRPWIQLISAFIAGLGMQGSWLMVSSMIADVCDEDELKTGLRREGVYGAVGSFTSKLSLAAASILGGILLSFSGYEATLAEKVGSVAPEVVFKMKFLFVVVQFTTFALGAVLLLLYPITRARAEQTRRILDERHCKRHDNAPAEVAVG